MTIDDEVEIAQQVVGQRLVGRRDHGLAAGHQVEHAAVGLHARDLRRRQPLGGAGLGLDHDLHAEDLGQRHARDGARWCRDWSRHRSRGSGGSDWPARPAPARSTVRRAWRPRKRNVLRFMSPASGTAFAMISLSGSCESSGRAAPGDGGAVREWSELLADLLAADHVARQSAHVERLDLGCCTVGCGRRFRRASAGDDPAILMALWLYDADGVAARGCWIAVRDRGGLSLAVRPTWRELHRCRLPVRLARCWLICCRSLWPA